MAGKRVLLTGASGFIGRNLLASELAHRHRVLAPSSRELDLTDAVAVEAWFAAHPIDIVIHSAVKPGHRNAPSREGLLEANLRMFFNLLRQSERVERILNLGSGAIYGPGGLPRVTEDGFGLRVPEDEHGFTKYVCALAGSARNVVDLRLFGVFGPHEDWQIRFVSNLLCKALHGLPLSMRQDRRFDFLWVEDLVPVLLDFIDRAPAHRAYNVTPDETVSLKDLAGRIRALVDPSLAIPVALPGLGPEYSGDPARLKAELPAFRPTPFHESLPRLLAWYRERLPSIDRNALLHDK